MGSGSVQAMIASLKSNNRLRRNKEGYSKFYKPIKAKMPAYRKVSKAEQQMRREAHRLEVRKENRQNQIFGFIMTGFYALIFVYAFYVIAF